MDVYEIPKIHNYTEEYNLRIVPFSDWGYSPEVENNTQDPENILELEKRLEDSIPDHVFADVAVPLTLLYSSILILGVFGNVITCIVILKNSTMKTATNYYLFSLAISDLMLLSIGMVLDFRYLWQTYPWAWGLSSCIGLHFVYNVAYNTSILTVLAFSFERYLAVCKPLYYNSSSRSKRPIAYILSLWLIGSVFSSIELCRHITKYVFQLPSGSIIDPKKLVVCELTYDFDIFAYEQLSFFIFFLLPMVIILILYIKMGMKIRESWRISSKMNAGKDSNFIRLLQSRQSTIRMLLKLFRVPPRENDTKIMAINFMIYFSVIREVTDGWNLPVTHVRVEYQSVVVLVTFICWTPNSLLILIGYTGDLQSLGYDEYHWITYLSDLFFYASTVINPVIYNLMSTRFRVAFKNTLCGGDKSTHVENDSTEETPL